MRVGQLREYLKSGFYNNYKNIIPPNIIPDLEVWTLGSGGFNSVQIANNIQSNYCLSLFHDGFDSKKIEKIVTFKDIFLQKHGFLPTINICCSVLYAKNKTKTKELKTMCIGKHMSINVAGNIDEIKEQLLNYGDIFNTKELIIVDICNDSDAKTDLIKILAEEFNF